MAGAKQDMDGFMNNGRENHRKDCFTAGGTLKQTKSILAQEGLINTTS